MSAAAPPTLDEVLHRPLVRARSPAGRVLGVATMAAALVSPAAASASDSAPAFTGMGSAVVEALNELRFWGQAQIGATGAISDWEEPGGVGLRASMSVRGIGLAGALRYEQVEGRGGGVLALGGQLRPLAFAQMTAYERIDPFLSLGGEVGGERDALRADLYAGAGLDFVLFPEEDAQPALVLEYQLRPLRTPSDTPLQILHLGAAMRGVF
ncbi:hypothetical protein WMF39_30245 [Sorangium sp. So ce1504]|uniref:hypothetical protein n=1 Tax=Sorangium sp. So ce1504 TaxID=3133337 RepID=UPI003F5EDDD9